MILDSVAAVILRYFTERHAFWGRLHITVVKVKPIFLYEFPKNLVFGDILICY